MGKNSVRRTGGAAVEGKKRRKMAEDVKEGNGVKRNKCKRRSAAYKSCWLKTMKWADYKMSEEEERGGEGGTKT